MSARKTKITRRPLLFLLVVGLSIMLFAVSVQAAGTITGQVKHVSDEIGIASVTVNFYTKSSITLGSYIYTYFSSAGSATTDASGNFSKSLAVNTYYIGTSNSLGYIDLYYNGKTSQSASDSVVLADGATVSNIIFRLPPGGTISGRVMQTNGQGISGAAVALYNSPSGSAIKTASADASGNYSFTGLSSGNYYIQAGSNAPFYASKFYENGSSLSLATPVPVVARSATTGINMGLEPAGAIAGRVTNATGGVSNRYVYAYNLTWNSVKSALTNSSGYFTIFGLPAGSYYVGSPGDPAYASEYYPNVNIRMFAAKIQVIPSSTTSLPDLQLDPTRSIRGKVIRESNGTGIAGVTVMVYESFSITSSFSTKNATTDSQGNYVISGLSPRKYFVRTSNSLGYADEYYDNTSDWGASPVVITSDADAENIDFSLVSGGSISGRVTIDSPSGVAGAGTYLSVYDANWVLVGVPTADASGNYRLGGLRPGCYYVGLQGAVWPHSYIYYADSATRSAAAPVTVLQDAETGNINFIVPSGGSIAGKVVRTSDGAALSGSTIRAYDMSWKAIKSVTSDSSGHYSISGLAPGSYYLDASNGIYTPEYYGNAIKKDKAAAVLVKQGGETSGIDFELTISHTGGSISGLIANSIDGVRLSGVTVTVYDSNWKIVKTGSTDLSGGYKISGMQTGNYYVGTRVSGFADRYFNDTTDAGSATLIAVVAGMNTADINFGLNPGYSILGYVYRISDGLPIKGVKVEAYDESWEFISSRVSDENGLYYIEGLMPGQYYVKTNNCLGYIDQYSHEAYSQSAATPLNLLEDSSVAVFYLGGGGSISGRVVNGSNGSGISDARVIAHDADWVRSGFSVTDENGNYTIPGLASGAYYLQTANESGFTDQFYGGATSQESSTAVNLADGQSVLNRDFGLVLGGTIAGTVRRDSNGIGISGMTVELFDTNRTAISVVPTDGSGNYSFAGLPAGDYYIRAIAPTGYVSEYFSNASLPGGAAVVHVTQGGATANINFGIADAGSISGRIISNPDGGGIANIEVQAFNATWERINSGWTDSDGYYSISNLPAGGYYLRTANANSYIDQYYNPSDSLETSDLSIRGNATAINVSQAGVTGDINFSLWSGAGSIAGRVVNGAAGTGLPGIKIMFYQAPDSDSNLVTTAITDASGYFSLTGFVPGDYYIRTANISGFFDKHLWGGDPVPVSQGIVAAIGNFELFPPAPIDFNGDGKPDILWRNSSTGEILVWYMDGPAKRDAVLIGTVDLVWRIAGMADFNRDNKTDILWRNSSTGENYIWYMNGISVAGSGILPTVADQNWKIAGLVVSEGWVDILWRNQSTGENLVWYLDGTSIDGVEVLPTIADQNWHMIGSADFNNDEVPDILWRNTSTGENVVWFMMEATSLSGAGALPVVADQNWKIAGIADFNEDQRPDILWRNSATGENYVWFLNGISISGAAALDPAPGADWLPFDIGDPVLRQSSGADFNSDGKPDILWRNASTGENYLWYMDGATVTGGGSLTPVADQDWKLAGIADFNSDGKPDVLWSNISTGENYLWYMNGTAVTGAGALPTLTDQNWKIVGIADFNSDGKPDILWRNISTGENYVWHMNGTAVTGAGVLPTLPDQNWKIAGAADFNNDGKPDVLWRNTTTGENCIWYLNETAVTGAGALPPVPDQNWKLVGIADFNSDSKSDILWRNASTGENYILYLDGISCIGGVGITTVSDPSWVVAPQNN
jgi:protocatechuate 3,4-dioxygenase beta subunit